MEVNSSLIDTINNKIDNQNNRLKEEIPLYTQVYLNNIKNIIKLFSKNFANMLHMGDSSYVIESINKELLNFIYFRINKNSDKIGNNLISDLTLLNNYIKEQYVMMLRYNAKNSSYLENKKYIGEYKKTIYNNEIKSINLENVNFINVKYYLMSKYKLSNAEYTNILFDKLFKKLENQLTQNLKIYYDIIDNNFNIINELENIMDNSYGNLNIISDTDNFFAKQLIKEKLKNKSN